MLLGKHIFAGCHGPASRPASRLASRLAFGLVLCLACGLCINSTAIASPIPQAANHYKKDLIRIARAEFGPDAPVSLLAAQIHQESVWNEKAVSPAGARGLAQFMPATAKWLPEVVPSLQEAERGNIFDTPKEQLPFNPAWALRALCAYNHWHIKRLYNSFSDCDQWGFALSAYNGGLGWVQRDKKLAAKQGYDPTRYFDHVERVNAGRSKAAIRENRHYPRRIFARMPAYEQAGWGPGVRCE